MAPSYVTEDTPPYGVAVEVAPGVRRLVARNPSYFSYHGTGTYIVGRGEVAVIDAGPRRSDHAEALLAALTGEHVTHQLITHTHGDHSPAAATLRDVLGAPTFGYGPHPTDAGGEADDAFADLLWSAGDEAEDAARAAAAAADPAAELSAGDPDEDARPDTDFVPDVTVGHGDVIEGPGFTFEALHTPGHISNHLCFAWREGDALFSGDHVMGWSTTIIPPPDGGLADYLASLELLFDRSESRYFPTHGPSIDDPAPFVRQLHAHRHARTCQVLEILGRGPASIAEIVEVAYVDVRRELHRPARRSILSHLFDLERSGIVERDGRTWLLP